MGFGNLKSESGLQALNDFLADKSYVLGYVPSQADVAVFNALEGSPPAKLNHALRWYNHIASYSADEKLALPGVQKPLEEYGPAETPAEGGATGGGATGGGSGEDDDDFDLFGSDDEEEDAEAQRIREERLQQYAEKKTKKPGPVAKSNIILDVKPWDDETDMAAIEKLVRAIEHDGLLWGASKLVPLAYGIKKLQISCVVEDEKVGTDFLEEAITVHEELIQSVDIAAFNKV